MIGIPIGFTKAGTRVTTSEITDVEGWTLSKGQKFIVLEMSVSRPEGCGMPVNIAIDNGFNDDAMFPVTSISENDFNSLTKKG